MAKKKSSKPNPQRQAQIKAQKHAAAILRKQGLYKPKQPRITNALVRNSRQLQRRLKEFQNVIRGEARAHKIGKRRIVVSFKPDIKQYVRAGKLIEREVEAAGRQQLAAARARLQGAAALLKLAEDTLADLRQTSPAIISIERPRYERLQAKVRERPDSWLKIVAWRQRKIELYRSSSMGGKDFSQYDHMLPDDADEWFDEFPELNYYREK